MAARVPIKAFHSDMFLSTDLSPQSIGGTMVPSPPMSLFRYVLFIFRGVYLTLYILPHPKGQEHPRVHSLFMVSDILAMVFRQEAVYWPSRIIPGWVDRSLGVMESIMPWRHLQRPRILLPHSHIRGHLHLNFFRHFPQAPLGLEQLPNDPVHAPQSPLSLSLTAICSSVL